jgi:Domain of unknown function (DUF4340)
MTGRFRGTFVALAVLGVLLVVWAYPRFAGPGLSDAASPDTLFRFEKEDLVGFSVERPGQPPLVVRQVTGQWQVDGEPWRPSKSMIRRVAHQLHDLDARADVVTDPEDPAVYGLGDRAIRVGLTLASGAQLTFDVGDPNPTGVSYYMRRDDRVYVVKKSAMDYWRLDREAYREDRIAMFDADDVVRLEAVVDGRRIDVERVGERVYRMHAPVDQPASRDEVRMMLGRVAALRAMAFVADGPTDLSAWGIDRAGDRVVVSLETEAKITVYPGSMVAGTDPPQQYVFLEQDDAVYAVKGGFLEAFRKSDQDYRDRQLMRGHEWQLRSMVVRKGGEQVELTRTADGWRWPGGAPVSGSTPRRLAERANGVVVEDFHPGPIGEVWASVELRFEDGQQVELRLGRRSEAPGAPLPPMPVRPGEPPRPPAPRIEKSLVVEVKGGTSEVTAPVRVEGSLGDSVDDLFRELGHKQERDEEKRLDVLPTGAP